MSLVLNTQNQNLYSKMDDFTVAIYCFSDDYCKVSQRIQDGRRTLNDAEIITIAIVSARYFGGT